MGWDPFGNKAAKKIKEASAAAAEAARQAAAAQAEAFRFNAAVLQRNADTAEEQGLLDEARNRRAGNRFLGEQDAAIAGSGFQNVGFDPMRENTSEELDLDAIIIRRQSQFRMADFESQSELALMNADQAIKTGEATARMAILNGQVQAQQAQSSAISGTIGNVTAAAGVFMSDARIKENIERIGTLPTGDAFYAYNYIWDAPERRRMGVMAQEVRQRVPEAVSVGPDGILFVDYAKLGLPPNYNFANAIQKRRRAA
jgi:hypothetical protein